MRPGGRPVAGDVLCRLGVRPLALVWAIGYLHGHAAAWPAGDPGGIDDLLRRLATAGFAGGWLHHKSIGAAASGKVAHREYQLQPVFLWCYRIGIALRRLCVTDTARRAKSYFPGTMGIGPSVGHEKKRHFLSLGHAANVASRLTRTRQPMAGAVKRHRVGLVD